MTDARTTGSARDGTEPRASGVPGGSAPRARPDDRRASSAPDVKRSYEIACTTCGTILARLTPTSEGWRRDDVVGCEHVSDGEVKRWLWTPRTQRAALLLPIADHRSSARPGRSPGVPGQLHDDAAVSPGGRAQREPRSGLTRTRRHATESGPG